MIIILHFSKTITVMKVSHSFTHLRLYKNFGDLYSMAKALFPPMKFSRPSCHITVDTELETTKTG